MGKKEYKINKNYLIKMDSFYKKVIKEKITKTTNTNKK